MKGLFILLLLINLAIFGWGVQRDPDFSTPQSVAHTGIGNIRLLSELPAAREQKLISGEGPSGVSESATEEADVPELPGPVVERAADGEPLKEADATPLPTLVAESASQDPDAGDPAASGGQVSGREDTPALQAEPAGAGPLCGAFGPFKRGATGREVIDLLKGRGFDASLRRDSLEEPVGYWVLIPPLPDRDAAVEKVTQLRESGIMDVRRFVKGEQKNGISLGVFSSRENALRRQKEVSGKGHSSRIVPRTITLPIYWVDYRADQTRVEGAEAVLSERFPEMKNEQYPCSRVVTSGGIF